MTCFVSPLAEISASEDRQGRRVALVQTCNLEVELDRKQVAAVLEVLVRSTDVTPELAECARIVGLPVSPESRGEFLSSGDCS